MRDMRCEGCEVYGVHGVCMPWSPPTRTAHSHGHQRAHAATEDALPRCRPDASDQGRTSSRQANPSGKDQALSWSATSPHTGHNPSPHTGCNIPCEARVAPMVGDACR
jgi:hypothetical protein